MNAIVSYNREEEKKHRICSVCGVECEGIRNCGHKVCDRCMVLSQLARSYGCPLCQQMRAKPPTGESLVRLKVDPVFIMFEHENLVYKSWYMKYMYDEVPSLLFIKKSPVVILKIQSVSNFFQFLCQEKDTNRIIEATIF